MNFILKNLTAISFYKKILLIIVNFNQKIIQEFKNIKFIESFTSVTTKVIRYVV